MFCIHCGHDPALERKLDQIIATLKTIAQLEIHMSATIADLQAEVTAETTIDNSLLALINRLIAAQADPAALDALLSGMKANIAPLAAALTANTGGTADPAATPAPVATADPAA